MDPEHEIISRIRRIGEISVDDESTARAVKRARCAVLNPPSNQRERRTSGRRLLRLAASIACVAGASVVVAILFLQASKPSVALAQIQERIQETRSIHLVQSTSAEGKPDESSRAIILASGLSRIDNEDGSFSIVDVGGRRSMFVSADRKRAVIWHGLLPHVPTNLYEYFKNLHNQSPRELPPRTIDGMEAAGFAVTVRHEVLGETIEAKLSIWVDPRTNLPVRMESAGDEDAQIVLHDIRFDGEVDESLIHFEPPEGAAVEEFGSAEPPTARALEAIAQLRLGKSAEPRGNRQVADLGSVLKLWESGKKDEAVEQLGKVDWSEPSAYADTPVVNVSESDYGALGLDDRNLVMNEAISLVTKVKELQRHAFTLGEQAQRLGNPQVAREHYEAILRFGGAMSSQKRLKIVQMAGQALVAFTVEKLAELE